MNMVVAMDTVHCYNHIGLCGIFFTSTVNNEQPPTLILMYVLDSYLLLNISHKGCKSTWMTHRKICHKGPHVLISFYFHIEGESR